MNFKDYQTASLKHLSTSKLMIDSIALFQSHGQASTFNEAKKKALLHNAFYLSGYTLETIINYAIFKHFKWRKDSIYDIDHNFSAKCDLSFYPDTQRAKSGKYTYWMSQHDFKRNIQILKKTFSNCGIPLIDDKIKVNKDLLQLYLSWKVEIRYHKIDSTYVNISLSEDNVKQFVDLTEEIYNNLMKLVG